MYAADRGKTLARPAEFFGTARRLMAWWGERKVSEIRGSTCRAYVAQASSVTTAKRDLEFLRAAVKHYAREVGMTAVPIFTMPPRSDSRTRWLTRQEAARLLRAARNGMARDHLARFILIGLYTGTRSGAILELQWHPNTQGGWVDLERGVMHRRAIGKTETKKRRPPVRIPSRLLAHMRRWRRADQGIRHVVHYNGRGIAKITGSWNVARKRAGLDDVVTPHVCRHTRATWLAQAGVPVWEAAGSLGMTAAVFEAIYGHQHPDYQKQAAEAY